MKLLLRRFVRWILAVVAIVMFWEQAQAQRLGCTDPVLPDPGWVNDVQQLEYTHITSDYGPRYPGGGGTNPHIGIDYGIGKGVKAFAVASGDIVEIADIGENDSRIKIGRWSYFHMEDSSSTLQHYPPGTLVKKDCLPGSTSGELDRPVLVFRDMGATKGLYVTQKTQTDLLSFCDPRSTTTVITKSWVDLASDEVLFQVVLDGQIKGAVAGIAAAVAAHWGLGKGMEHSSIYERG